MNTPADPDPDAITGALRLLPLTELPAGPCTVAMDHLLAQEEERAARRRARLAANQTLYRVADQEMGRLRQRVAASPVEMPDPVDTRPVWRRWVRQLLGW